MDGLKKIGEAVDLKALSKRQEKSSKRDQKIQTASPSKFVDFESVEAILDKGLPETVHASLKADYRYWSGSHGMEFELRHFDFDGAPDQDTDHALAVLEMSLATCPREVAVTALTALKFRTSTRETVDDQAARISMLTKDISVYPQDVVVEACNQYANDYEWFPTSWSKFKIYFENHVLKRRKMFEALKKFREV